MIWSAQFDETIRFYTEILGFTVGNRNDDWGWASIQRGAVEIMVAKPNAHTPFEKPIFTGSFYININEVDALWEQLKDKTDVCYEIETFDWGMREFAIYDNNGYLLQFGENVEILNEKY